MQNYISTIFFDLFGVLLGIDQSVVIQYLSKLTDTPYLKSDNEFKKISWDLAYKKVVEKIKETSAEMPF